MFRIGEFSRLAHVPVKTLHYYDDIGLFRPAEVDRFTGYRYYTIEQLVQLNRILALKGLGFTLEEVQGLLADSLTPGEMRAMLRLRQSQLQQEIAETADKLTQVEIRIRQLEQNTMADILLKQVPTVTIVGAREVVPVPDQMRERCIALNNQAAAFIQQYQLHTDWRSFALYHDNQDGIDVEMAYAVQPSPAQAVQNANGASLHTLPPVTVAYAVYQGSYDDFGAVGRLHAELHHWVESNGYRLSGASREHYLRPQLGSGSTQGVMEIQYPVEKA